MASHLVTADLIEEYAGQVDSQMAKKSIMREFTGVHSLTGTDTKTVRRLGTTSIQGVGRENTADITAASRQFDRAQVTVAGSILARDQIAMLAEFQTDFALRMEIGQDHGKLLGKAFDAALLNVLTKGADAVKGKHSGRTLNWTPDSEAKVTLGAANDENDPDAFYAAIEAAVVAMQENDMDTDECVLFVRPAQKAVLMNNDKLISRDFSKENGDFATGTIKTVMGCPIVATARLADATTATALKSALSAAYGLTAADAKVRAIVAHPKSLLVAEAISLKSNVWEDDKSLSTFVDSYMAFGAAVRRADHIGSVFAA